MLIQNLGQQRSGREQPKSEVTLYGYRRQNHYDYVSTSSQVIIRYNIYPIGLAKMQYLRAKMQMILGHEEIVNLANKTINPFYKYAIQRIMYFEEISAIKKTNYIQILVNQFAEGLNKQGESIIQVFVEKTRKQIDQEKKQKEKQQRLQQKQYKQHKRIAKLINYEAKMLELKQLLKQPILKEQQKRIKANKNKYLQLQQQFKNIAYKIDETFKNIDSLQNLKLSQAFLKYSIFQKRYKGYYDIQLKLQRRDSKPYFVIRINRLSKQIQPVLQNLTQLVQQRDQNVSYKAETKILITDIFNQVKKFQNINGAQNKNHYIYLGPETVLFDQIALIPKLSYEPLLLEVFGLKNRPMTAQSRICFNPSPRSFDYFKSLPQYDKSITCMLNDPFYGNKQIYENDMHRLSSFQKQQISKQQQILSAKKQQIVVWRLILLSNYLNNSIEYGLCPQISFFKKQQHHKSKLQILQKQVQDECSKLCQYLGIQQNPSTVGKFEFSISRLSDFLQPLKQNDSIIQKYKDTNIKKYFQWRNHIVKQIVRLLVNDCLFGKVYNVKKYIIIYVLLAIEIFQEYNYLVCLEDKESRQVKNVQGLMNNRRYFKGLLETQVKRLKGDKSHISYQLSTYNKIIEYGQKRKITDPQAKYIKQDQIGKILFEYVKLLHSQLKLFHRLNDILNQLQLSAFPMQEDYRNYREISNDIKKVALRSQPLAKNVLGQLLYNQLKLKHRQGPHKISSDANKQVRYFFSLGTQRLDLISLIYLNFDQSKLILYDTLILPQFNLLQNDKKVQIPNNFDFLVHQENKLSLVAELIGMAELQPKKMTYLVNKGDALFEEIEKSKRQLLYIERSGEIKQEIEKSKRQSLYIERSGEIK